jgi:hypothetical protein
MIRRLRKTFRVSRQCHRLPRDGSSIVNSLCSESATSGSIDAEGGRSGRDWNCARRFLGMRETAPASSSDICDVSISERVASSDTSRPDDTSRLGKMRCWIQYDVPPTMIGTCFLSCVSLTYTNGVTSVFSTKALRVFHLRLS